MNIDRSDTSKIYDKNKQNFLLETQLVWAWSENFNKFIVIGNEEYETNMRT